jgi:hypothetical protein
MSAVPESCSLIADPTAVRREIERLSREKNNSLEIAIYAGMSPTEQNRYDHRQRQVAELLRQLTALSAGDVSKLSAKMVELSLQEAQRDPTLPDIVPEQRDTVPSSLRWSSDDIQGTARSSFENAGRTESLMPETIAVDTDLNRQHADRSPDGRIRQLFFTLGNRLLGTLTLATERSVIGQRTTSMIKQLSSRSGMAAQFVADRVAATNVYRCRDCGKELGFRSRPRTVVERYILPLFLMQPIRCAACFRRDYWSIITRVHKRSHRDAENLDCTPTHAA